MIRQPPSGDPYLSELVAILNAELGRKEPAIVGWRHDGTNLHVRFRAPLDVGWVQVHIQSTESGEGGPTYDAANFTSSTEVDCRSDRLQDVSVADLPYGRYVIFLIPVEYDGAGTKIVYDGGGTPARPDFMSFVDIGV